jgi:hypothetical protein
MNDSAALPFCNSTAVKMCINNNATSERRNQEVGLKVEGSFFRFCPFCQIRKCRQKCYSACDLWQINAAASQMVFPAASFLQSKTGAKMKFDEIPLTVKTSGEFTLV